MATFYLKIVDTGEILELEAVESVTESFSGRVTSNPLADRSTVADTFIKDLPTFTLNGIISGVSQPNKAEVRPVSKTSESFIKALTEGALVDFISSDRAYNICVITNITLNKTSREGLDSWKVSLTLNQINLVPDLAITIDEIPIEPILDDAAAKKELGNSTTKGEVTRVSGFGVLTTFLPEELIKNLFGTGGG